MNKPVAIVNTNCENNIQWYDDNFKQHNGYFLYTHPVKELTDGEIEEVWIQALKDEPKINAGKFPSLANQPFVFFARAILRKAQEK